MVLKKPVPPASPDEDVEQLARHNIIVTTLEKLWNWGRARSFWPLNYGCNCCPIELLAASGARFDISRYGYEVFRASPRQADLLLVAGPISLKMAPVVQRVYEQMPSPNGFWPWAIVPPAAALFVTATASTLGRTLSLKWTSMYPDARRGPKPSSMACWN